MGGSLFWPWLAGLVQSCGALAAQSGWLICVEVTVSFSVFKIALASLLLCQMGMAFQELRWPMERTAVLGYLAPS